MNQKIKHGERDLLYPAVRVVQQYDGYCKMGIVIDDTLSTLTLTIRDRTERDSNGKLRIRQRVRNTVSNKLGEILGLFVPSTPQNRGFVQLTEYGMNVGSTELYKLIHSKRSTNIINTMNSVPALPFSKNTLVTEGKEQEFTVKVRDRSVSFVKQIKEENKANDPDGLNRCNICNICTEQEITLFGIQYIIDTIEMHHINRISKTHPLGTTYTYEELKSQVCCLCPTCHDTLHKISPEPHPDDLKEAMGY